MNEIITSNGEEGEFRSRNRIVGVNDSGDVFLVEATFSRDIHPDGYDLPAHVLNHNGKWAVAFGDHNNNIFHLKERLETMKFNEAGGVIIPRRMGMNDEMSGYEHSYVILD